MEKITDIETPLNPNEKYLYGINMRLEVLIDQVGSLLDAFAKVNNLGVEGATVEKQIPKTRKARG